MDLKLYSAARSNAAHRVRIALNLKGLAYDYVAVDLAGAEQHKAAFRAVNPQRLVPALEADGRVLTQSLAILEWLEETHPAPPLLPTGPWERAIVRSMAQIVVGDIHPLINLRILRALGAMRVSEADQHTWMARWINDGMQALELMVIAHGRGWAFGDEPGLADCCLIPQVAGAERWGVSLEPYPAIRAVAERAAEHPAFAAAHPKQQPDMPAV
jgi:maleylacetoacetate isomerase/maleylpyruvate isomerase